MAKKKLPLVAICGRPNVGKSTLFNRITGKARAIVHDEEGITRDRAFGEAQWEGRRFRIVDTGGIIENPQDSISEKMQGQVKAALDEARVILLVVDGQASITRIDREMASRLLKLGKPVVLAVNKLDNFNMLENRYEFYELGLGDPWPISSGHGTGTGELLDEVVKHLPPPEEMEDEEEEREITRVAIVGKPNVGKSSFVNAILNEERAIVDPTAGTTRDAIDIPFHWKGKDYLFIDTAGLRKKAGITKEVERFSVARTLRAIKRADVCMLLIDPIEGMSEQDKRIIGFCLEAGTAMILVWTKWDLIENKEKKFKALADEIDLKMPHIKFVPYVTVSNMTRQRLFEVFKYIDRVAEQAKKRIPTAEFNKFLESLKTKHQAPGRKGKQGKIKYGTQTQIKPTTFLLFVNDAELIHFSYQRFIENQLREKYGFEGVPIKLELREGAPREGADR
jgi:GTP-binding protein